MARRVNSVITLALLVAFAWPLWQLVWPYSMAKLVNAMEQGDEERAVEIVEHKPGLARENIFTYYSEGGDGYRVDTGLTPLHKAAQLGLADTTAALLEAGAEVNKPTKGGGTPLQLAARPEGRNLEVVRALVQAGAKVDATTLATAAIRNDKELMELLLSPGPPEQRASNWALRRAVETGHLEMVRMLLENGAVADDHTRSLAESRPDDDELRRLITPE